LPLRPAGGAAHPLLELALRLLARSRSLRFRARLGGASLRELADLAGCSRRIECRIEIDRACELDQDGASLARLFVQEPFGAVEPSAREPRQCVELLSAHPTRGEVGLHGPLREAAKRNVLATRADRRSE